MRRKINTDKIEEVTVSMMDKINLIQDTKNVLINDIQEISNFYNGIDADAIKAKYTEKVNKLDVYINTINSYTKYFKWLTNNYGENLNNTKNNLSSIANEVDLNKNMVNKDTIIPNILNIKEFNFDDRED